MQVSRHPKIPGGFIHPLRACAVGGRAGKNNAHSQGGLRQGATPSSSFTSGTGPGIFLMARRGARDDRSRIVHNGGRNRL